MLFENKQKDKNEHRTENDIRNRNKSDFEDIENNANFNKFQIEIDSSLPEKNFSQKINFEYGKEGDVGLQRQEPSVPHGIGALKEEILEVGSSSSSSFFINLWQEDLRRAMNIGLHDSILDGVIRTQSGTEWTCESTFEYFENQFSNGDHQNGKSSSSGRECRQGGPEGGSIRGQDRGLDRGQDRGQDRMNIVNITTNCVKYLVSSLIVDCSTLSALIRNDVLDTDLEIQAHLSNLLRQRNSAEVNDVNNNDNNNENKNKEKIFDNYQSEIELEKEEKNGKFLRSKSILDANNVTLGQNSIPLLPSEILLKSRIIFQKAENISTIITSFFEIILFIQNNQKKMKSKIHPNLNLSKILAEKLKIILNFLLEASCATIECVSKILYVLPCPYIVSVMDWARTVSCLLHFRSASMYVLTLCHRYNTILKENVSTLGQNSKKKSTQLCLLSPLNLETVLLDMEDIIDEEVNKVNQVNEICMPLTLSLSLSLFLSFSLSLFHSFSLFLSFSLFVLLFLI